jgi:WD40 repeat protein
MLRSIDLESRWIETLVFVSRPAATWLLAGSSDGTIQVLDLESGARLRAFNPGAGGVMMLAISPNGAIGASAHLDGTIRLWDVTTGAELGRLIGHTALVNAVAFSPDGSRLASAANDTTVRVWDATSHEGLTTLRSHEHWVLGVAFSPDGTRIVSGGGSYDGSDCALRLWEAPGPRQSNGP